MTHNDETTTEYLRRRERGGHTRQDPYKDKVAHFTLHFKWMVGMPMAVILTACAIPLLVVQLL